MSSTAKEVTPRAATSPMVSIEPSGRKKPTSTWSGRKSGRSSRPVLSFEPWQSTWTMMSAELKTWARSATIVAPFAAYSASGKAASVPAPASTITAKPAFTRLGMTAGTSATRRSPGYDSRGTPIFISFPPIG